MPVYRVSIIVIFLCDVTAGLISSYIQMVRRHLKKELLILLPV